MTINVDHHIIEQYSLRLSKLLASVESENVELAGEVVDLFGVDGLDEGRDWGFGVIDLEMAVLLTEGLLMALFLLDDEDFAELVGRLLAALTGLTGVLNWLSLLVGDAGGSLKLASLIGDCCLKLAADVDFLLEALFLLSGFLAVDALAGVARFLMAD